MLLAFLFETTGQTLFACFVKVFLKDLQLLKEQRVQVVVAARTSHFISSNKMKQLSGLWSENTLSVRTLQMLGAQYSLGTRPPHVPWWQ